MDETEKYLKQVGQLNVAHSGERRAPHKPLLLLIAISQLFQGKRNLRFNEVELALKPLLDCFAPPVKLKHQPALPYWHLRSDGLWEIPGDQDLPLQKGKFPIMGGLRQTQGRLPERLQNLLLTDSGFAKNFVRILLNRHFPYSLHDDILNSVGLKIATEGEIREEVSPYGERRRRDPNFRDKILQAYEYCCAATGFRASIGASYFGCEAAHVKWYAYDGPDVIENGVALEPTLHKLFDAGAWTLADDRRILVSATFSGSDEAVGRIRALHGRPLREPLPGYQAISVDFIRWHRESEQGGVFRKPALPL